MANGRNPKRKGHDTSRDQGGFIALPWSVLDCPAYGRLSHPAKALLLEVARQFVRDNNGRMLLSRVHMATRGWKSMDTLTKCKAELLEAGFIFETVQGHRPNKASWYAVTWRSLDKMPGFDAGTEQLFKRGAYQQNMPLKNATLIPPRGTGRAAIVPPRGTETLPTVPPRGTIKAVLGPLSVPPHGHHLEMPSPARRRGQGIDARKHGRYFRLSRLTTGMFTRLLTCHNQQTQPTTPEPSPAPAPDRMAIGQQAIKRASERHNRPRPTLHLSQAPKVVHDGGYVRVRDGDQLPEGW